MWEGRGGRGLIQQMIMKDFRMISMQSVPILLLSISTSTPASVTIYLLLLRKRTLSISPPTQLLKGTHLVSVTSYKYLGVLITSNLMWSSNISNVCNKTRRLIGILYKHFYQHSSPDTLLRLYTSFMRQHLEYITAAWDPFLKKDISLLS